MTKSVELRVSGLDCENEARQIERGLATRDGIVRVQTFPKSAKVRVEYDPARRDEARIAKDLTELGFPVQRAAEGAPAWWRSPKLVSSLASGVLLLGSWIAARAGMDAAAFGAAITTMIVGGFFFGREAIEKLARRTVGIELLMSVAAIGAALLGETFEAAMLVFLYSISEAAEGFTEEKTRAAVRALMKLAPKVARVKRDGGEVDVAVEDLVVGDRFIVRPGESIATDGIVQSGVSSVDQAPVTGESVPVPKKPGDPVFAGTVNAEGALEVEATKTASENTLARIIHMVEEAQEKKGERQRFVERFGNVYSPSVLLASIAYGALFSALTPSSFVESASRAIVLVVAAAPCALAISIPISMVAALGTAARGGVLIKGGVILERLASVDLVMLDKTGTITRGRPSVTEVVGPLGGGLSEREALAAAAALEARSEHPVARAIVEHASALGIALPDAADVTAIPGMGIRGRVGEREVYVGRPELFTDVLGVDGAPFASAVARLAAAGMTLVVVGDARHVWLVIGAQDAIRDEAIEAVRALHALSIEVRMLSGDHQTAAGRVAESVGIDRAQGDLRPDDKLRIVREEAELGRHVAMVGDGVNDAPALAAASVGVAMGAAGTDVAIETADVALMGDDLRRLAHAISLARRSRRIVRQNLALSALVIGALSIGAVAGFLSLPGAVVVHEVSEWIVIASGLRLLRAA